MSGYFDHLLFFARLNVSATLQNTQPTIVKEVMVIIESDGRTFIIIIITIIVVFITLFLK